MKLFRMLGRGFRDAMKSLVRNFNLSIASVVSIGITLTILGAFLLLSFNVENFTKNIKGDVSIVVFLDNELTRDEVEVIGEQIKTLDNIKSMSLETKEEVRDKLAQESEVFASIMSNWGDKDNPLSDTYNIKVEDVESIKTTANTITEIKGVKMVEYGASFINDLLNMFSLIEKIGLIAIAALVIVTSFLIANTIKLTITARRNEIDIMRLVGASDTTIKLPFIVEGLFLGIIGSITPILFVLFGYSKLYDYAGGKLFTPIIKLIQPEPFIYQISLALLLMGMIVGMWGSAKAVRKYLKI